MTTTDQLIPAIRTFADRYGLPDGLEYNQEEMWVTIVEKPPHAPRTIIEGDIWDPVFWIWLAAALAHWEAKAEDRHDISVLPGGTEEHPNFFTSIRGIPLCGIRKYTPGDLLSRLTARTLALLDGVNAIGGEG